MRGIVITPKDEVTVKEFSYPYYQSIGETVGGLIENIHPRGLQKGLCMVVNDSGLLLKLEFNFFGSLVYGFFTHGSPIVGNIVIVKEDYTPEGIDYIDMTDEEIKTLKSAIEKTIKKFRTIKEN